MGAMPHISGV
jgi:hypothetical protein